MTREEVDSATFDGTITANTSETLEVQTGRADDLVLFVDNGTTGTAADSYSVTVDAYTDEVADYQRQSSTGANTSFYHEFAANGSRVQLTISDESGTDTTARITVKSYRSME